MGAELNVICLDLEGVLIPEIWISFAEKTGLKALRRTTRDEPDYDKLMRYRLEILDQNGFTLTDIQAVIATLSPLPGARQFLDRLRETYQVVILSDTFYEFAMPLIAALNYPTLFCHRLIQDEKDRIIDYQLRLADHKRHTVEALRALNFHTVAAGDSYNDTNMLAVAHRGILFRPPQNVIAEFPQFPVTTDYDELAWEIDSAINGRSEVLPHPPRQMAE